MASLGYASEDSEATRISIAGLLLDFSKPVRYSYQPADVVSLSDPRRGGPHHEEIVRGVEFNRSFIVTYNILLLVVLLVSSAWNFRGVLDGAVCRIFIKGFDRANVTSLPNKETGRSGSENEEITVPHQSTSRDANTAVPHVADERQPLLHHTTYTPSTKPSRMRAIAWTIKSCLIYQPGPLPVWQKPLPNNLTSLTVLAFLGLNLFYLMYGIQFESWSAFVFADRAGLLFVANLPVLYLFSAKNCPLGPMTGYSYEHLNIMHRRTGELLCLLAVLHAASTIKVWYDILLPVGISFWQFLSFKIIWIGLSALACYETLYMTSLSSFRSAFYESFLASHIFLQFGGLTFLFLHHSGTRPYVGAALGIFLIDRVVYRCLVSRKRLKADLTVQPDGHTVLLSAHWDLPPKGSPLRRLIAGNVRSGWAPTDHVFVSIPSMPWLTAIQAHPFTIASAAPDRDQYHARLELIIRARDGFTRHLLRHAQRHHRVDVAIDGPYGSHHALELVRGSDLAVLVAGGSGVAVTLPLASDLVMRPRADKPRGKVVMIWIVHDARHVEWVGRERLEELRERGLEIVIPPPTTKAGRPDLVELVESAVGADVAEKRVGVVVSGPNGMNREVNNCCAAMVRRGVNVGVSVEKFGW